MKRDALLSFIFITMLILSTISNAAEPGVLIDFTTQASYDSYVTEVSKNAAYKNVMDTFCSYEYKDGYTRFTSKKTGDIWLTVETNIPVSEYKFIAIKYRASGAVAKNNIYTKDDTGNTGYSPTDKTWVGPGFTADNDWHVRILNVDTELSGATGNITGLRIPIVDSVDGTLDLEYIAAFKTEEDAKAYEGPGAVQETNTPTGVVSFIPSLVVTCMTALGITKKRKW